MSKYNIEGTTNIEPEQSRGAYLDENFWTNFNNDINKFKQKLIDCRDKNIPFSLLRMGHAEYCFLTYIIPLDSVKKLNGTFISRILNRHYSSNIDINDYINAYETIINVDYNTTQIGYDFKNWLNDIVNFKNVYIEYKNKNQLDLLFNNTALFCNNHVTYDIKKIIDMPLDIVYALVSNKWILKMFKNKIGFIGNTRKLDVIKNLMKFKEYQTYIENDYFTDYIDVDQRCAFNNVNFKKNILDKVKNSSCDIFLCGLGVSKLNIFNDLKKTKNCIYIDVGHGIDAIAGLCDYERPYFGSWQNYNIKGYNYNGIDFCGGPSWNNVITLH